MTEFDVPDMSCESCVRAITRAVQAADPAARLRVDLVRKRVSIDSARPSDVLEAALQDAGFDAVPARPAAISGRGSARS